MLLHAFRQLQRFFGGRLAVGTPESDLLFCTLEGAIIPCMHQVVQAQRSSQQSKHHSVATPLRLCNHVFVNRRWNKMLDSLVERAAL